MWRVITVFPKKNETELKEIRKHRFQQLKPTGVSFTQNLNTILCIIYDLVLQKSHIEVQIILLAVTFVCLTHYTPVIDYLCCPESFFEIFSTYCTAHIRLKEGRSQMGA